MSKVTEAEPHKTNLVESKDGTLISYDVIGEGPGLIVIPGAMAVAENYNKLAEKLSGNFTVYTIQRRGRGWSGEQGENYSLRKEVEDVLALQQHTLATFLFGHSYGGLIALEISLANTFDKVAVYEPAVSVDGSNKLDWLPSYEKALGRSDNLTALAWMMRSIGSPFIKMLPLWAVKLYLQVTLGHKKLLDLYYLLPANLNEQKQLEVQNNIYHLYNKIETPILLMRGKATKLSWAVKAVNVLKGILPNAQSVTCQNLDHFAPVKKPASLFRILKQFFS